jgi:hypothetical protein
MAITYNWSFPTLTANPTREDKTDVINTVHWILEGTSNNVSATVYGAVGIAYESDSIFTAYNQLTKNQITEWVENALGEDQINNYRDNISKQIEEKINPINVNLVPSWN